MDCSISTKYVFHRHVHPQSSPKPSFLRPPNRKWSLLYPPKQKQIVSSNSNSTNYGGWEDLKLEDHHSSQFHQVHNFVVSLGIDDTKHVFMLILGFISALAISRVRVSSILVFPATVFVFSIGFSLGRRGFATTDVDKKASKTISVEKLITLVELFAHLNAKITDLEKDISGPQQIGHNTLIKSLSLDILQAKNIVEASVNDAHSKGETIDDARNSTHKSTTRKRDPLNILHFFGSLFQENASVTKPSKLKRDSKLMNNQNHHNVFVEPTEQAKATDSELRNEVANNVISLSSVKPSPNQTHRHQVSIDGAVNQTQLNGIPLSMVSDTQTISSNDEFSQDNYISQVTNNGKSMNASRQNGKGMLMSQDYLYDSLASNVNTRSRKIDIQSSTMEFKASLLQEANLRVPDRYDVPSYTRKKQKNQTSTFDSIEKREKSGDLPNLLNQQTASDLEDDSASLPSSVVSEDLIFNKNLTEATNLLKEARGYFKGKVDEDRAEVMLYKCARLLSRATVLRPMSLLAVGQLGNTFLLHGELKLMISRELRTFLSGNHSFSSGKTHVALKLLDEQNMSRDRIASLLIDVCEECEGLLIEAGRQYRMALSIDGSDVRALYNWGLALSYRAQLLADVGPEAASDADRVYLAAIDKFNEMMSRNKAYAPDALFRWGIVLQQRSRLRPSNANEKMKLLQQAKSLFEDALSMDSNNDQLRGALSSCISELNNYSHF